jgi:hypothetical protein
MKKTFNLKHPKTKAIRLVEQAKGEVKKYLKRENRKKLPDGMDYWDFNCRIGATETTAAVIHVAEIGKSIDSIDLEKQDAFYLEILAKPTRRTSKNDEGMNEEIKGRE